MASAGLSVPAGLPCCFSGSANISTIHPLSTTLLSNGKRRSSRPENERGLPAGSAICLTCWQSSAFSSLFHTSCFMENNERCFRCRQLFWHCPHDWQVQRTVKIVIAVGWAGWPFLRPRSIDFHGSMRIIEETLYSLVQKSAGGIVQVKPDLKSPSGHILQVTLWKNVSIRVWSCPISKPISPTERAFSAA